MRLVIQRVSAASVSTEARGVIGQVGNGLCVLVGIGEGDGPQEIEWCKKMILDTKFWENADGKPWKSSVKDLSLGVLLISQFTLYAKMYKKGKLDFHHALAPEPAKAIYESILAAVAAEIGAANTQAGEFGAMMQVAINNDGPVTITLDSAKETAASSSAAATTTA